jgi:mRNA interferase MazF
VKLVRGRVYLVDIGLDERKRMLVVSNKRRNNALGSALAVRLTTTDKPSLPSIVPLSPADRPLSGAVVCDDLMEIWPDEAERDVGALTALSMAKVEDGLKAALDLP